MEFAIDDGKETMKIIGILQARISSSRLPGKVLKPILGRPMLERQLERLARVTRIDKLIVATSDDKSDDALAALCQSLGITAFRGSLDDVLDRFYRAALMHDPVHVVRLTGDCPLCDPKLIDEMIQFYLEGNFDYLSNALEPTYPDGLDVEIFRFSALKTAWKEAGLVSEREHVTPFLYKHREKFNVGSYKGKIDLSRFRWTVDEAEDLELVQKIYETLYPRNPAFTTADILSLLEEKSEWNTFNMKFERNEGYKKSVREDSMTACTTMERSMSVQARARSRIPGMTQLLSKRPDQFSLGVWPGYFSRAKGAEVWDLDDNRYLDMSIGGIGANVLGYADPDVDAAVMSAVRSGNSSSLNCPEDVELAELLCEIHPWADKVRYARTGGESMTVAVRIARAHTGRDKVAFCGYHGWHDWYLAANVGSENALGEHLLAGLDPAGVPKCLAGTSLPFRYNRIDELEKIVSAHGLELAAIVMEPIRNDPPLPGFLESVRAIASEIGAVFIIDEISAGFRMNTGGAHLMLGVSPDIAVFSKALGNGYPIGAIIGRAAVMDSAQSTFISSTYWTERIGPAAAIATIRKHMAVDAGKHLMKVGSSIQEGWKRLAAKQGLPIHVGGIPPLSHYSFDGTDGTVFKALFVQMMLERGFLASTSFYSMYTHTEDHVQRYLQAVDEVFGEIVKAKETKSVGRLLRGQPASSGFKRLI